MAYPVASAAQTFPNTGPTPQTAEPLTPSEQETCDQLYEELKPMAVDQARSYVLNRTPVRLQEAMTAKIEADWPVAPVEDPLGRGLNPGGNPPALPGYAEAPPMFGSDRTPLLPGQQNVPQPPPQDPRFSQGYVDPARRQQDAPAVGSADPAFDPRVQR